MGDVELTTEELACLVRGRVAADPDDLASADDGGHESQKPEGDWSDVLHALTSVWQDFALRWSSLLTTRLRVDVHLEVAAIEQTSYGGFIFGLDHPTCLQVITADGMSSPWLVEQHPSMLFPLLDRLLGGGSLPPAVMRRPLTEIESRLVQSVTDDMLRELQAVWQHIVPVRLAQKQMESNPKLVRAAHPGDEMLVTLMKVAFGESNGLLRFGMTKASIEAVSERLLNPRASGPGDLCDNSEEITVSLAATTVKKDALMDLRVGDILTTDTSPEEPAILWVNGHAKFHVTPGAHAGKKAVRIESER